MKVFRCSHCDRLVFFENTACVNCGRRLAYLADRTDMGALVLDAAGAWRVLESGAMGRAYRLCANGVQHQVCNWAVPYDDPVPFCRSCRLNRIIPNLSQPGALAAWRRLETAKRRLIHTLLSLRLPLDDKARDPARGLAFEFLADEEATGGPPILTGHHNGVVTINVAEADDAEREKRRLAMDEPYRTLLGHFRHEVGHYFWDRLIGGTARIDAFRRLFGDERQDYGEALQRHHWNGPPSDWAQWYVSAYASAHPWEDWAETWAHYLLITDALETADACGLSLRPTRTDEPALVADPGSVGRWSPSFEPLIERWFPLTYIVNNLNRGLGRRDFYPFVLSRRAIDKLRFIHEVVGEVR